eukprot:335804_1
MILTTLFIKSSTMELIVDDTNYTHQTELARDIQMNNTIYNQPILFHAFWFGEITEKHLISIRSCYHFNVYQQQQYYPRKIILWIQNSQFQDHEEYNLKQEIEKYSEIRVFDFKQQTHDTFMQNYNYTKWLDTSYIPL